MFRRNAIGPRPQGKAHIEPARVAQAQEDLSLLDVELETGVNHGAKAIELHRLAVVSGPGAIGTEQFARIRFGDEPLPAIAIQGHNWRFPKSAEASKWGNAPSSNQRASIHEPLKKRVTAKYPNESGQGDIRTVGQAAGPFLFARQDQRKARDRADDAAYHEAENRNLASKERADGSHKFYIAKDHGLLGQHHAFGEHFHVKNGFGVQNFIAKMKSFRSQTK